MVRASLATLLAFAAVDGAAADNIRAFAQKDAVVNWEEPLRQTTNRGIKFDQPARPRHRADDLPPAAQAAPDGPENFGIPVPLSAKAAPAEEPATAEGILAKYGDPKVDKNVVPRGDAPPEFMGMAAAINIGDEKLAFEYARAYARRTKKVQDLIERASELQKLGAEVEGIDPVAKLDASDVTPERLRQLENMKSARAERLQQLASSKFDKQAEKMLQDLDQGVPPAEELSVTPSIQLEPPVDPNGQVLVLAFFSPSDGSMEQFVGAVTDAARSLKKDSRVDFKLLSIDHLSQQQIAAAEMALDIPLRIHNGAELRKKLNVGVVPSVLLVARTTKAMFPLEELKSADELRRVIGKMQGGRG